MARGELLKNLLLSYGRDEEFRQVVEQIIVEEEKKNNRIVAKGLRKALDNLGGRSRSKGLSPLIPFPDEAGEFIHRIEPERSSQDIVLSQENRCLLIDLIKEYRKSDLIKRHGLEVRSKILFCGPPGTGKTLCAEVFAGELGLPFFHVKIDRLISSYLGETASNVRKIFEFSRRQPCVLFFDEFDAIARSRAEGTEHSELRRVVNSLLIFIEQIQPSGFLVAATNLDDHLDAAIWRRFDEVIWFEMPDEHMIQRYLAHALKNVRTDFDPQSFSNQFQGCSYADLEKVCNQAIKKMIITRKTIVSEVDFREALRDSVRRRMRTDRLLTQNRN